MKKTYLLTPGPTQIPESIHSIFARPILHHRTPSFQKLFQNVQTGLQYLFQTRQEVLLLASSGTGAMDASVSNLFNPDEKVIVLNAGKFGERWLKIAKAYHLKPIEIKIPWGESVEISVLNKIVNENPDAKAILFQASETSTGVMHPTQEICRIAQEAKMLSVCDAITACGVFDLPMDRWGIDVLITGSQKALMLPPGLAMLALSPAAWKKAESSKNSYFYFNLQSEKKNLAKNQTSWTPAITLIQGLEESLRMIQEEGLVNVFRRHEILALATRNAIQALGLHLYARKSPSIAVTAVEVPTAIADGKLIPKTLRDQYGVTIAGGQDELEGKIFRLSHFGYCGKFDITTGISALELVLNELGYRVEFGKGVGAALKTFSEHPF